MRLKKISFLAGIIVSLVQLSSCYNILVYVLLIGKSHVDFGSQLVNILVERGHTVDLMFGRLNDRVSGNGTSKARRIKNFGWEGTGPWSQKAGYLTSFFEPQPLSLDDIPSFREITVELCEMAMSDSSIVDFIREGNYDIAIATEYDFCPFLLFDIAKVPSVVGFVPTPIFPINLLVSGVPVTPRVYASCLDAEHDQGFLHTMWHLLKSIYEIYHLIPKVNKDLTSIARKYYGDKVKDDGWLLAHRSNILFVNSNELLEKPLPLGHKIKYIGGLNLATPKPLSKDIDEILNRGKKGAVVFSFGTQAPMKYVPFKIRKAFVEAFKRFPDFVFIWKYERQPDDADLFAASGNAYPLEWIPQWNLLNDPRVVGFISHSGLNSFNEGSHAGVPMIAVPLFVDQLHNAKNGERLGISILLKKNNITTETIVDCLKRLLLDEGYRTRAKTVAEMLKNKPEKGREVFVEWVEYAAKYGNLHEHLNLPGALMTPIEYYLIDFAFISIVIIILSIIILKTIFKAIFSRGKQKRD